MLLHAILSAAVLGATAVLGDANTITRAMTTIKNDTTALGDTVTVWNGRLLGTVPIVADSLKLLEALGHGSVTAERSTPLSIEESIEVATVTEELAAQVNTTLEIVIRARPKFDAILLRPAILVTLELQKAATQDFSSKVVEKVPENLQAVAKSLIKGIYDSFDKAIDAYHLF